MIEVNHPQVTELVVDGVDRLKSVETTKEKVKYSVNLKGKSSYGVRRVTNRIFPVMIDPFSVYTSPNFTLGASVLVECLPDDLRVKFVSLGTAGNFVSRLPQDVPSSRKGDVDREYAGLIFPKQGYVLFFQPIDQKVLEKLQDTDTVIEEVEAEEQKLKEEYDPE